MSSGPLKNHIWDFYWAIESRYLTERHERRHVSSSLGNAHTPLQRARTRVRPIERHPQSQCLSMELPAEQIQVTALNSTPAGFQPGFKTTRVTLDLSWARAKEQPPHERSKAYSRGCTSSGSRGSITCQRQSWWAFTQLSPSTSPRGALQPLIRKGDRV